MRLLALALVVLLLAGCVPTDPASYEAAAAGMRQATAEAVGMMSVEAQHTEAARARDGAATVAAATQMVVAAHATMEMASAQATANAQAVANFEATQTLGAAYATATAQPTSAAATATAQAQAEFYRAGTFNTLALAAMLLIVFATAALILLLVSLAWAVRRTIAAWADRRKAEADEAKARALRARYLETSQGLCYLDPVSGASHPVVEVEDGANLATSEVEVAAPADVKSGPTMGEMELFVRQCIAAVGRTATHIPSNDVLKMSGAFWSARTDRLAALGMIPQKQTGRRTLLLPGDTLHQLLARVADYERTVRQAPSPNGGSPASA